MKIKLFTFLLALPLLGIAQSSNVFHDREFWKSGVDLEVVKQKIKDGNDPTALNAFAFDAVTYSLMGKAPNEITSYLLSLEGNEVTKGTHDGRNYLMWAAYSGNIEMMKELIALGSDTKIVDSHGYNVLTFAANAGQQSTELYDLILANGGSIEATNRAGANILLLLSQHVKDEKLLSYLQEKGLLLNSLDNTGNGVFNYAAQRGNLDLMKKLVEMGVNYKAFNFKGENCMLFASHGRRHSNPIEVYQYLANLDLDIDIVSLEGQTPLHDIAAATKDVEVLNFFIKNGVSVNQIDKDGNTAFLNAAKGSNLPSLKRLLPLINDINQATYEGTTAIAYAVQRNAVEAFNFLKENGAKLDFVDAKGNNIYYHIFNSFSTRNQKALDAFVEAAKATGVPLGKNTPLLHIAIEKGNEALIEKALALGVDINQKNEDGLTPLHFAAMKAKGKKLLTLLLKKGADKNILTEYKESAFDLAVENEALKQKKMNLKFLKLK